MPEQIFDPENPKNLDVNPIEHEQAIESLTRALEENLDEKKITPQETRELLNKVFEKHFKEPL